MMNAGGQSSQASVSSSVGLRSSGMSLDSHLVYDYVMVLLHWFAVLGY
jgi:hypothetical protein